MIYASLLEPPFCCCSQKRDALCARKHILGLYSSGFGWLGPELPGTAFQPLLPVCCLGLGDPFIKLLEGQSSRRHRIFADNVY